ncbi:MAG: hemolysin family protein [Kofleriaceae bacterium]|nr:hemolysin family protein [Kofleriaceae bacterium]
MAAELLIVLALVLANGLFAGAEIAILSVRKTHVQERAGAGHKGAKAVQTLRDKPERFLATVQIGITVVGAAAAAFGGSSIAVSLTAVLESLGLGASAHEVALVIVVVGISFLSLVLGELVPKSLALRYSAGYAFFVSRPLLGISKIASPLVWFLTACSNLVLRMFGDRTSFTEARMSRDELQQMVEEAAKTGDVDPKSSEIASRALELADVTASEVMVRREEIVAISKTSSAEEIQRLILEEGHSRMPVYDGELDNLIGYVVARDLLAVVWEQGLVVVDDIIRPLLSVPLTSRITTVLREMQARGVQIAAVVDEHGGTAGMVTIEDLIEELIGDVLDEDEVPDPAFHIEPEGTVLIPGWVPIRKVNRTLGTALPIARESTTMAGLCIALALSIPATGARFKAPDGTLLEVVDASSRRVRMVRVQPGSARD